jgi:hypothetical protein
VKNMLRVRIVLLTLFVCVLNTVDSIFSLHWLENGIAEEMNVLMAILYNISPYLFLLCKLVIVNIFIMFVGTHYDKFKLARFGIFLCLILYSFVIFYHIYGVYLNYYLNTEYYA